MEHDNTKQPLVTPLLDLSPQHTENNVDPYPQHTEKNVVKKKCYSRSRSAHVHTNNLAEKEAELPPVVNSIVQNLNPSFKLVILFFFIYVGVATLCFYLVRDQIKGLKTNGVLDAVYFCIVTMTTVGYGDLVPNSTGSKLLASAFVFTGMALVGIILSKSADRLMEKQEILLVRALHINETVAENQILKEVETNKVRYKFFLSLIMLLLLMLVGTIFLYKVEKLSLIDAIYCVCSTITTLGYGDESFSSQSGRTFAVFWILTSTICLAQFFLYLAELNTESRQQSLVKWVISRKFTSTDLEAADLDHDKSVSPAEFIIYKLKELGKINQEDISLLMEEFNRLDIDHSGTLSSSDLLLS